MTNKTTVFEKLNSLVDFGISQAFLDFIARALLNGSAKEKDVLNYCIEVEERYENRKLARPRHLFSSVSSRRSNRHSQFWYK